MSAFLYMARNWGLKVEKCKITLIAKLGKKSMYCKIAKLIINCLFTTTIYRRKLHVTPSNGKGRFPKYFNRKAAI